jgi:hypothetical protein
MPRYKTYTLRIECSEDRPGPEFSEIGEASGMSLTPEEEDALSGAVQDAEDVINDHLPEGFYCKIDESGEGVDLAAVRRLEEMS